MVCFTQLNSIFRAGCDSPPAVKSASMYMPNRCDSGTDSEGKR